jgi:hypothetical protein
MPVTLSTHAIEKSTYVVTAKFYDEADNAITPVTLKWTLTDEDGTVINSRTAVVVAAPAASNSIALTGLDLAVTTASRNRIITFEATYNGDLGTGLALKESAQFVIDDLVAV